ncbi:MAG: M1 family aminopeptidase [Desulfuromonadaceae bacterium]|nr:M1 family aminopeptidase [Desulfuromonadaceae bacterium]
MHICILILAVIYAAYPTCVAFANGDGSAVLRQEIEVTLKPSEHLLIGVSTITITAGTRRVALRLSPTATIESVTASGATIPSSFLEGNLTLDIPAPSGSETLPVTVSYRVYYNDPLPLRSAGSEDPTYGVHGVISTQGTFLGSDAEWYPTPSTLPLKRSVRVSAPAGIEAITAGRRVQRGTHNSVSLSLWEELKPVGRLSLCAGPYRIEERREGGIDLYGYFYPDNAALAARYLEAAASYLRYYSDLFGPYPFEKFAVVENFFPTGYGFPSFTLLGSSIIRLPFIIDTSLPHEIVHSWWGNAIQVDQKAGNWSEGLTTYLADYLLKERRSASEGKEFRKKILSDFTTLVTSSTDFPLSRFSSRVSPESRAIGYGKSAMVFHMIRTEIGNRAFFAALRNIYAERLYRSATWDDFKQAFSRSSGKDLSLFMEQWLARPSGPRVVLSNVTRRHEGHEWIVSGSVVQTPPFYEMQVPLRLATDAAPIQHNLPFTGAITRFTFTGSSEPRHLLLDPDAEIFRVLDANEIPVTVNSIKSSKQLLAVISDECRATEATFRGLLVSLGKSGTSAIREADLTGEQLRRHDLIFCGIPKQSSLLPLLPAGITLHDSGFSVAENDVHAPDGLIFLTLQAPAPSGRVIALFRPLSAAAADRYAPKITHYGTYGSLLFSNGSILHKGSITPSAEVSSVDF